MGSPIAGRTRVETEGLIPGHSSTRWCCEPMSPAIPTARCSSRECAKVTLDAYAISECATRRDCRLVAIRPPSRHLPLFQVWFVLQDPSSAVGRARAITSSVVDITTGMDAGPLAVVGTRRRFGPQLLFGTQDLFLQRGQSRPWPSTSRRCCAPLWPCPTWPRP